MLLMDVPRGFYSPRLSQACQTGSTGLIEEESSAAPAEPERRSCGHKGNKDGLCRHPNKNCLVGVKEKEKLDAAKKAASEAKKKAKKTTKTLAAVAQYRIGVSALDDAPAVAMSDSDR